MSIISGIFPSEIVDIDESGLPIYDRAVDEEYFAKYHSEFLSNGVYANPSNNFQVMANELMKLKLKAGSCFINGYYAYDNFDGEITLEPASSDLNRIDRIVTRLDRINRKISIEVKKGAYGTTSYSAPSLQRDDDIWELGLADVLVKKGTTQIVQANITDLRAIQEYCGYVYNPMQNIDTTDLFAQYDNSFEVWFQHVKEQLSTDAAGNLQKQIDTHTSQLGEVVQQIDSLPIPKPNLLRNSSAEYGGWGSTAGWFANTISGSIVHNLTSYAPEVLSGYRAFKMSSLQTSEGYISTEQDVDKAYLKPKSSTKYVLSAYVKTTSADTEAYISFSSETKYGGTLDTFKSGSVTGAMTDWARITVEFTPGLLEKGVVKLHFKGKGSVLFDNVKLEEKALSDWCMSEDDLIEIQSRIQNRKTLVIRRTANLTGTQEIGLGFRPKFVRIIASLAVTSGSTYDSEGTFTLEKDGTSSQFVMFKYGSVSTAPNYYSNNIIVLHSGNTYNMASLTSITEVGFVLAWSASGVLPTGDIIFKVEAIE